MPLLAAPQLLELGDDVLQRLQDAPSLSRLPCPMSHGATRGIAVPLAVLPVKRVAAARTMPRGRRLNGAWCTNGAVSDAHVDLLVISGTDRVWVTDGHPRRLPKPASPLQTRAAAFASETFPKERGIARHPCTVARVPRQCPWVHAQGGAAPVMTCGGSIPMLVSPTSSPFVPAAHQRVYRRSARPARSTPRTAARPTRPSRRSRTRR